MRSGVIELKQGTSIGATYARRVAGTDVAKVSLLLTCRGKMKRAMHIANKSGRKKVGK